VFATNGILPLGNGMTAHGLGGAGIANPGDAMAGTDNPALLADTGNQMAAGLTLFSPRRAANLGAGYVDSDKNLFEIPSFGWTKVLNQKMNAGILITAMGGMNTTYPAKLLSPPYLFGPFAEEMGIDLSGLIIAPTLSYAPSEGVAYGASLLYGYEKLTTTLPAALPYKDGTDSATGTGLKVGFSLVLDESLRIGGFYQSRIKMGEMDLHCNKGAFMAAKQYNLGCEVNMPPITGVGFNVKVDEKSKIVLDLMYVAWSKVGLFKNAFGWVDQNIFKIGYEHHLNSSLTLRYGVNYGSSPLNSEAIVTPDPIVGQSMPGVLAPAVTERHYVVGFTKKLGNNELVGYYALVPKVEQTDPGQDGFGGAKVKMYQHALGVGYNWK